jgi:diaminopropionate ammonia-lyase family
MSLDVEEKSLYVNPAARSWRCSSDTVDPRIERFHRSLPGFAPTPLVPLDSVAAELGVRHVFIKDESNRMGLPSFKIFGASWATYRAVISKLNLTVGEVSLEELSVIARREKIGLFTASAGNHGRAVARMAKLLRINARVFVPMYLDQATKDLISGEDSQLVVVPGEYDSAVQQAKAQAERADGVMVQDTAFGGYEDIPQV